ncbi:hypothetical protein EZJ43_07955 [Pedobacter changchengzhani]|uniref:Uncharacterized protein n=1 Tax=Pedobacter changchengzhani TaxID=2529274 RepID=A0A4V3A067_9SPHI|nr:hypothetical protein [Pedobacter changchengzhani]TDG36443.1 hypothetical protein EZJ43_07955 [Pedobacter changchengzhani]
MKNIEIKKWPKKRKFTAIAGIMILLISVFIIYPIEMVKANFVSDFVNTYLGLAVALLLLMLGLMGKYFVQGLSFMLISTIFGFTLIAVSVEFGAILGFIIGIPSGVIAGMLFLVINFYFLKDVKRYRLPTQIISYCIILCIVSFLFYHGGDWIYDITQYFNNKS